MDDIYLDRDFVDRLVVALAARHEGKPPTEAQIKKWFEYASRIAMAREAFWSTYEDDPNTVYNLKD